MPLYSIHSTVQTTQDWVPARTQAFRVKMDLSSPVGFLDTGLFVFAQKSATIVEFQCIASPTQLAELPLNAPNEDSESFFRMSGLDLAFGSKDEGLAALTDFQAELKTLCDEMAKLQTDVTAAVTTTIASDT